MQINRTKFDVTPADRKAMRRNSDAGYIGVLRFHDGPRGGRFRSVRTGIFTTPEAALAAANSLARNGSWRAWPSHVDVATVNTRGIVTAIADPVAIR